MSGDIFWMTDSKYFRNQASYAKTFSFIDAEYKKSTEDFIKHFKSTYSDPYAPAWMISEIIPFGTTVQLYKNLADQRIRKQIARQFGLQPQALESWVTTLALTRNACCHHSRVWNKVNLIIPADAKQMSRPWLTIPVAKDRIYFNICMIKFFLDIISPTNDFKNKLLTLFGKFPQIDLKAMGFPTGWDREPLWQ
jgi:abortive infection bacteriophage resistance protein